MRKHSKRKFKKTQRRAKPKKNHQRAMPPAIGRPSPLGSCSCGLGKTPRSAPSRRPASAATTGLRSGGARTRAGIDRASPNRPRLPVGASPSPPGKAGKEGEMHREVFGQGEGGSPRRPPRPRRHRAAPRPAAGSLPRTPSLGRDPPEDVLAALRVPALSHLRRRGPGAWEAARNGGRAPRRAVATRELGSSAGRPRQGLYGG